MARDPKVMRKAYEYKLGKDLASKLSDKQISIISEYYNSLSAEESSDIDSKIVQGRNDTELHEMAIGMVEETESKKTPPKNTRRLVRNQSEKKTAVDKTIDTIKASYGGNVSEELDSLLNIIREEGDKKEDFLDTDNILKELEKSRNKKDTTSSSKLAKRIVEKSQSIQKTKPQKFEADPEAAKVLGIDPFDLTEDEYKTLLKERMIKDRMGQKTDSGEAEIITNEFKRVKKGTPIKRGDKVYKSTISPLKLLPGTKVSKLKVDKKQDTEEVSESVDNMNETLEGIDNVLKDILGQDKKEDEREKREAEKSKQASEEKKSEEDSKKKVKSSLRGFKAPKIPFLDRVKDFFKNILLGGAVLKLVKWIQNPENQKTISDVTNFITNNLDKILLGIGAIVGLGIGGKILGFLVLLKPLLAGIIGLLTGPLGLIALIAALPFAITAALKKPIEDTIVKNYGRTYGEEYAEEGAFITKLGDQYGRIASKRDKERLLDDDEKATGLFIAQYDGALKERKRLSDEITRDTAIIQDPQSDRRSKSSARKRLSQNKKSLKETQSKIKILKSQISIDGKSLEILQQEFVSELKLPQTGLSKELYSNSGTGEKMSGVPEYFGQGKEENSTNNSLESLSKTLKNDTEKPTTNKNSVTKNKTPTAAELTESEEGTGNVPSTTPTQDNMTFELDVDSTRFAMPENTKPIEPPKPDTPDLSFLPLSMRNKAQPLTSGSQAGQKKLTGFSSEDSNNLSIASVRSVYNSIA